jgi:hypothetical protein
VGYIQTWLPPVIKENKLLFADLELGDECNDCEVTDNCTGSSCSENDVEIKHRIFFIHQHCSVSHAIRS